MLNLSLCTFVKNEEVALPGMIKSVRKIVNEVIVVDTGSTDSTLSLARTLADKVIETPFTNFGEIRTFTLRQASCSWILMLDADERILEEHLSLFQSLIEQQRYDAWLLPRRQWDNLPNFPNRSPTKEMDDRVFPDFQSRLFINSPSIHFVNPVHESLKGYRNQGTIDPPNGPEIQHYGRVFKDPQRWHETHLFYQHLAQGKNLGDITY